MEATLGIVKYVEIILMRLWWTELQENGVRINVVCVVRRERKNVNDLLGET